MLKARDDHVGNVLEDAKKKMITISKDQSKYPKIIEGLIAQVRKISLDCSERITAWIS